MMLAAINYQNSLIFALAFLLVSMFMVSILHTFRNLSGLTIHKGVSPPAFAGEDAEFDVRLTREGKRTYEALVIGWKAELLQDADLLDSETKLKLFVKANKRGIFNPGRLLIQSNFPVGLFRAWSWVDLGFESIIYPKPIPADMQITSTADSESGSMSQTQGVDDFQGMREYQNGDSLRHIAWKSYARTQELYVKEFAASVDQRIWLDWENFPGVETEMRLCHLVYWVVKLAKTKDAYGLRLPGIEIPPNTGFEHREALLYELARYDIK